MAEKRARDSQREAHVNKIVLPPAESILTETNVDFLQPPQDFEMNPTMKALFDSATPPLLDKPQSNEVQYRYGDDHF